MSDGMSSFEAGRKDVAERPGPCMVRYGVFFGPNPIRSGIWIQCIKVDRCEYDGREFHRGNRPRDNYYCDDLESLSVRLK